jgi:benzoate membrane transport protein
LLAAIVGFVGSFAVLLQGMAALGADPQQAASGLAATALAMGGLTIILSLRTKLPISIVWSTPGAALIAASGHPEGGVATGVGAVLIVGVLLVVAGIWRPATRWLARIPAALANGMLAGILFELCLAPVRAVAGLPLASLLVLATWLVVGRLKRLYAVPAAALVAIAWVLLGRHGAAAAATWPHFGLTAPAISMSAAIGLALPLFIVTMASQNVPGLAVMSANGYQPAIGPILVTSGVATAAVAPLGGMPLNLAALTAALCAGSDAHADPGRRYWAAVSSGFVYLVLGSSAGLVTSFLGSSPVLLQEVAGLALLGAFGSALLNALAGPAEREAALVTFLVAASGTLFLGIGAAFWGLLAGGGVLALQRAWSGGATGR